MNKLLRFCLCCMVAGSFATASALPPLGLTPIGLPRGGIEVIDGTLYMGVPGGVRTISTNGTFDFITVNDPFLGAPSSVTNVVKGFDGELYAAANFGSVFDPFGSTLFRLDEPSNPLISWDGPYRVRSVDRNLTAYGNLSIPQNSFTEATRFLLNGTIEPMLYPEGSDSSNNYTSLQSATPSGYALGDAGIPGTLGIAPLVWTPSGEPSFIGTCCLPSSIRDRNEGNSVNVGTDYGGVKYGLDALIRIKSEDGSNLITHSAVVSQSQFVSLYDPFNANNPKYAFYPGIVSGFPDRAAPLLDIFPELAAIDIDAIHDLASVDGYLYMTLSGADGTFLFGARDPSVVPEPAGLVMVSLMALGCLPRRGR